MNSDYFHFLLSSIVNASKIGGSSTLSKSIITKYQDYYNVQHSEFKIFSTFFDVNNTCFDNNIHSSNPNT